MAAEDPEPGSVRPDELAAFARRLAEWGETLSESERPFVQMLVERTRELELDTILRHGVKSGVAEAARAAIDAMNARWRESSVWLLIGPIWLQRNTVEWGEEIEITQRLQQRAQQ
jgi:hypothetical protein